MSLRAVTLSLLCLLGLCLSPAFAGNILFVRDSGHAATATDTAMIAHLVNDLGHVVTQKEANDATIQTAAPTADLVIISSTVGSGTAIASFGGADALKNLAVPVFTWEDAVFDELGIRTGPYATQNRSSITITPAGLGHPLSAGLSGEVIVHTQPQQFRHGTGANAALWIATIDNSDEPTPGTVGVIQLVQPGDALVNGGVAPARRLGYFYDDDGFSDLTAEGLLLYNAAVNYMIIPEPATLSLLGLGALALLRRRR